MGKSKFIKGIDLKNIPFGTEEAFNVLIEISKGSPNKYEYDEKLQALKLDFVFKDGFTYNYNYGLIPGTLAGDGDHLDVIVWHQDALGMGTTAVCRAIGMIELIDRGEEDNKIIAVLEADKNYKAIRSLKDLPENWTSEAEKFFQGVATQKNKIIKIKGFRDKERALAELKKCQIKK